MVEDVKPHQLTKQVGPTDIVTTFTGPDLTGIAVGDGWETIIETVSLGKAVHRSYIDLAGWTKEELTTFVQGVDIQKMKTPFGVIANSYPLVWEYDILSTRRIALTELTSGIPGFIGGPSTIDLQSIVYGESRTYAENATIPGTYVTTDRETFGTGDPVATDKLHWTRIIRFSVAGAATLKVYPANLVVQAVTAKEKDLVWMERLRRSYVLQGEI